MRTRAMLGAALLAASSAALTAGSIVVAPQASADPANAPICGPGEAGGTALSGDYGNLTVRGIAYVPQDASVTVRGNLTVAPGGCLDAFSTGTVTVGHNVVVGTRAVLGLGCAPKANDATEPCGKTTTDDTIGGNLTADQPLTMYLTSVTVGRNVTSTGGGFGTPGLSFPVKGMKIGGNLVLTGWHGGPGAWIGAMRNTVGGNLVFSDNAGFRPGHVDIANDSSEVDANLVGRNLICHGNTPAAQYGDAYFAPGNGPNTVAHQAIGECSGLTTPLP